MSRRARIAVLVAIASAIVAPPVAAAPAATADRGRYLATIAACVGCHTARAPGSPLMSGGTRFGSGPNAPVAANLTPDRETGLGAWTDAEIVRALREGTRPDGTRIAPPMPQGAYGKLSDPDLDAIVAFLRSVPPARNAIPRAAHAVTASAAPSAPEAARPPQGPMHDRAEDPVAHGRYLFEAVTHCAACHVAPIPRRFAGPHGPIVAPSLTAATVARLSDSDLETIIRYGRRPDGTRLEGPMPVAAYASLTSTDLAAMTAYLRQLGK